MDSFVAELSRFVISLDLSEFSKEIQIHFGHLVEFFVN